MHHEMSTAIPNALKGPGFWAVALPQLKDLVVRQQHLPAHSEQDEKIGEDDLMYTIDIPGRGEIQFAHAVFDFNGTLANGGDLLPDLSHAFFPVSNLLSCMILTADSFGSVYTAVKSLPVQVHVVKTGVDKAYYVEQLEGGVIAVGNGSNDYDMFIQADLSIATAGPEGTAAKVLQVADIIVPNIYTALDLIANPKKIIATLRL